MVADPPQEIPIFCDFTHSQNCKLDDAPSSKNAQAVVMAFEKLADDLYASKCVLVVVVVVMK